MFCVGRMRELGKWKSDAVERLGGPMQADALFAQEERWFREWGKPLCQTKILCAAATQSLIVSALWQCERDFGVLQRRSEKFAFVISSALL